MTEGRREQISIDDFGNLLTGRSHICTGNTHAYTTTMSSRGGDNGLVVSTGQLQDEIQDQIQWYRKEVERKERLVDDLRKSDNLTQHEREQKEYELNVRDSMVKEYRMKAHQAREELTDTIAKLQAIEADMRELKEKLNSTSSEYSILKCERDRLSENNSRQAGLIHTLREDTSYLQTKITQFEEEARSLSSQVEVLKCEKSSFESEIAKYKEIILELEVIKNSLMGEKGDSVCKRRELYIAVLSALGESSSAWDARIPDDVGELTAKIEQLRSERDSAQAELTTCKAEIVRLTSVLEQSETEVKAGRETIMRLVAETERTHQSETELRVQIATIDGEKSAAVGEMERLKVLIATHETTISEHEDKVAELHAEIESLRSELVTIRKDHSAERTGYDSLKGKYENLRENIAALLSCSFQFVDKTDDSIVIRLKEFLNDYRSRQLTVESLEVKQSELSSLIAEERQKYEELLEKLSAHKTTQEDSPATHGERVKFLQFIAKLSELLKMESISGELGLDVSSDAVLHRVKSLVEKEDSALAEKTSGMYQLQRKVKQLKEELEGKELHLDMMRKKVASLEEKSGGRMEVWREKEELEGRSKKMERMNERLRAQLGDCKVQITSLKAELSDIQSVKLRTVEKDEEIRTLLDKLDHLEKTRNKQAKQLAGLKQELKFVDQECKSSTHMKEENISSLAEQLSHAKRALEEVAKRERQLVQFRALVAKVMGMEVCSLTVPDYEIISKLEQLLGHHHHVAGTGPGTSTDLDNFWEGYERAKERLTTKKKPVQTAW